MVTDEYKPTAEDQRNAVEFHTTVMWVMVVTTAVLVGISFWFLFRAHAALKWHDPRLSVAAMSAVLAICTLSMVKILHTARRKAQQKLQEMLKERERSSTSIKTVIMHGVDDETNDGCIYRLTDEDTRVQKHYYTLKAAAEAYLQNHTRRLYLTRLGRDGTVLCHGPAYDIHYWNRAIFPLLSQHGYRFVPTDDSLLFDGKMYDLPAVGNLQKYIP